MNKQPKQNKNKTKPTKLNKNQKLQVRQALATGAKSNRGGILSEAGGILGSVVGLPGVGRFLGSAISSVLGRGDYTIAGQGIRSNSLVTGTTPPAFGNERSDRATVISHREYLTDITTGPNLTSGATDFNQRTYFINPGLASSFPWMARVAQNFEEYEMLGCIFEYKSTSGNALNSTNTALGTVILSTQYNVLNDPFGSKLTQENYEFAQSLKPAESGLHAVECARNQNVLPRLYIRSGDPPADSDQRMYDLGQFQISTVGMQAANVNIGELWITYHIALYKPKVPQTVDNPVLSAKFYSATGTASYPLGNVNMNAAAGSTLACTMAYDVGAVTTTISFPSSVTSGFFLVLYFCNTPSATVASPGFVAVNNTSIMNVKLMTGGPGINCMSFGFVQVTGPAASFKFASMTATTPTNCTMYITQWSTGAPLLMKYGLSKQETNLMLTYAKKLARLHGGDVDISKMFEEKEEDIPDSKIKLEEVE